MSIFATTEIIIAILIIVSFFILSHRIDKYLDETNQTVNHGAFGEHNKLETIALAVVAVLCPVVNVIILFTILFGFDLIIDYAENEGIFIDKEE